MDLLSEASIVLFILQGNREVHIRFNPLYRFQRWIAAGHYDYGYTRLRFVDRLHIELEQIATQMVRVLGLENWTVLVNDVSF